MGNISARTPPKCARASRFGPIVPAKRCQDGRGLTRCGTQKAHRGFALARVLRYQSVNFT